MMGLIAPYRMAAMGLGVLALIAMGGLARWRAAVEFRASLDAAVKNAVDGRDAHWRAEIAASNALAEAARAEQAINAAAAEGAAQLQIAALENELQQQEADNAALPNGGACGLGRDRVRLLND